MAIWNTKHAFTRAILSVLTVLLSVAPLAAKEPKPKHLAQLGVFDANGKKVGKVIGTNGGSSAVVAFRVNGQSFVLSVGRDSFGGNVSGALMFETPDFSGPQFMDPGSDEGLFTPILVFAPGSTLYTPDRDASPRDIDMRSFLGRTEEGEVQCSHPFPDTPDMALVTRGVSPLAVMNLDDSFTPPFSVP